MRKARRWKPHSPGPKASVKASCGVDAGCVPWRFTQWRVSRRGAALSRPIEADCCAGFAVPHPSKKANVMADVVAEQGHLARAASPRKRASLHNKLGRKSTVAFFLTLPLILLIAVLV